MVLKMRIINGILLFIAFTLVFSCQRMPIINCSDCSDTEPLNTNISIKISQPGSASTIINVYEGDIEDNILFKSLTTNNVTETTLNVPVNKKYTLTATYNLPEGTYTAVDSAFPRVKYDEQQCENPCYYVYDNMVNLRLKYQ